MKKCILLMLFLPTIAFANVKVKFDEKVGKTEFLAVGNPGFLKINGTGKGPKGSVEVNKNLLSGTFEIDLNQLETGMKLRNDHMKDKYLEVKKFPTAKLIIEDSQLPQVWTLETPELKNQKLKGFIEMHGQKKPVVVECDINKSGLVNAKFELKITDYKIDIPSFMGVTVADKVTVQVETKLGKAEVNSDIKTQADANLKENNNL